jgi:phosphoribosylamine-glycine ligase
MLSDEKADFVGFFVSNLIWAKNDWYVLSFQMRLNEDSDLSVFKKDLVYLFNSAIYCKLNEIEQG